MTAASRNTRTCLQDLVDLLTLVPLDYCSILANGGGGEPFITAYRTVTAYVAVVLPSRTTRRVKSTNSDKLYLIDAVETSAVGDSTVTVDC